MATLRDIRRRIRSVKSTQQITKAMYMVSAAKLRRAQEAAESNRPYADGMAAVVASLAKRAEKKDHPLLQVREEKKIELVLITSDRGLCGGFNSNLIRMAEAFLRERRPAHEQVALSVIGKKARDYFRRRKVETRLAEVDVLRRLEYAKASDLAADLVTRYLQGEVDGVYLIYPVFKSAMVQRPTTVKLLPLELPKEEGVGPVDYIYEPNLAAVLADLLPRYVRVQFYRALLESRASEHGARMTAMDAATSNASDMIGKLTLKFNRARQATITKELMEIIGGKEALEK
jgi:F-type H+-transporting ATPase subunit gamma